MVSHCLQPFSAPCGQADNCSMPWGLPVLHLGAASNPCSSRISCGEVVGIPPGVREPPCLSLCMLQGGGKCSFSFSQACSCKAEAELSNGPGAAPPSSPVLTGCSGAEDGTGGAMVLPMVGCRGRAPRDPQGAQGPSEPTLCPVPLCRSPLAAHGGCGGSKGCGFYPAVLEAHVLGAVLCGTRPVLVAPCSTSQPRAPRWRQGTRRSSGGSDLPASHCAAFKDST